MKALAAPVLFLLAASLLPALADDNSTAIAAAIITLEKAVDADAAKVPPGPDAAKARGYVKLLKDNVGRNNFNTAINNADHIGTFDPTPEVQKIVAALTPLLSQAEADAQSNLSALTKTTLDDATTAVKTKTSPKDFDPVLSEVESALATARSTPMAPDREQTYNQLQGASRFVRSWQNYLVDKAAGNSQSASNDLRLLSEGGSMDTFSPIPRSDLLQLEMKEAATASTSNMAKIQLHSLDDVPSALAQIEMLQRTGGGYSQQMGSLQNALMNLESAYTSYQIGNFTAALQQLNNGPFGISGSFVNSQASVADDGTFESVVKEIASLKNSLLLKIVQALLAMPNAPAPQPDEHAADYLERLAADRAQASDWNGLQQVLQVYQQLAMYNPQPWLTEDMAGLHAYLIGEKLEKAGENLDAIRSYRQALATLGKYFPAAPAAAKLDALKKAHPDLYQQAIQQPILPATPR
jgi:tetratricopeptide (TPR) repeat protein